MADVGVRSRLSNEGTSGVMQEVGAAQNFCGTRILPARSQIGGNALECRSIRRVGVTRVKGQGINSHPPFT